MANDVIQIEPLFFKSYFPGGKNAINKLESHLHSILGKDIFDLVYFIITLLKDNWQHYLWPWTDKWMKENWATGRQIKLTRHKNKEFGMRNRDKRHYFSEALVWLQFALFDRDVQICIFQDFLSSIKCCQDCRATNTDSVTPSWTQENLKTEQSWRWHGFNKFPGLNGHFL